MGDAFNPNVVGPTDYIDWSNGDQWLNVATTQVEYTWSPEATFRIFTDQELKQNELLDAGSRLTPRSINRVLGISGSSGLNSFSVEGHTGSYGGIWTSGALHLYGENCGALYSKS